MDIEVSTGDEAIENDLGPETGEAGNGIFGDLGDGGQGGSEGETDWSDPTRGRPKNKADSPFVNIIPFAKFSVPADLYFLGTAFWRAQGEEFFMLTSEEQGMRIVDWLKRIAVEHFIADQENPPEARQYSPELLFTASIKDIAKKEAEAARDEISEDLRKSLAEKLRNLGRDTLTMEEAIDLVLLGGENLG